MTGNQSFVYIWRNNINGKRYIGVHKGSPSDGYICSSKLMLEEYDQYPQSFQRKVLAVFGDYKSATEWESALCKKVNAKYNQKFYNMHNGDGKFYCKNHTKSVRERIGLSTKERWKTGQPQVKIELNKQHSIRMKEKYASGYINPMKGQKRPDVSERNRIGIR